MTHNKQHCLQQYFQRCIKLVDQTLRNEAGYEEYELDASNKDFAIVALDLLSGLGIVTDDSSAISHYYESFQL